jgi:hypothetical protein
MASSLTGVPHPDHCLAPSVVSARLRDVHAHPGRRGAPPPAESLGEDLRMWIAPPPGNARSLVSHSREIRATRNRANATQVVTSWIQLIVK